MSICHERRTLCAVMACAAAAAAAALSACTTQPTRQGMPIRSVADWGGTPPNLKPNHPLAHRITRLTLHHQGEVWKAGADVSAYLRNLQRWSTQARGWVDIPYHYIVADDGQVYAARPVALAGDTNTNYDPRGHLLVMLLGNFEVQEPTAAQWASTAVLVRQLLLEHNLAVSQLGVHRHFASNTVCPGANFMTRFEALRAAVASGS
jgi:hypothetical protein